MSARRLIFIFLVIIFSVSGFGNGENEASSPVKKTTKPASCGRYFGGLVGSGIGIAAGHFGQLWYTFGNGFNDVVYELEELEEELDEIVLISLDSYLNSNDFANILQALLSEGIRPKSFAIDVLESDSDLEKYMKVWKNSDIPMVLGREDSTQLTLKPPFYHGHTDAQKDRKLADYLVRRSFLGNTTKARIKATKVYSASQSNCPSLACTTLKSVMSANKKDKKFPNILIKVGAEAPVHVVSFKDIEENSEMRQMLDGKYVFVGSDTDFGDWTLNLNGEKINGVHTHIFSLAALLKFQKAQEQTKSTKVPSQIRIE